MSNRVTADMTPAQAAAVATYVDSDEWTVFEDHLFVACCNCGLAHRVEVRQHNVGQRAIRFIRLDEFTAEIRKRQHAEHETRESRSAGNGGEPKACTPAEERGYAGATGAGQLPDDDEQRLVTVRKGAHPLANNATPAPDEGNRHGTLGGIVTMSEQNPAFVNRIAEYGWVIEGGWTSIDKPDYWVGSSAWSEDPLRALRFARRQDAQQAADLMLAGVNVRICEHEWMPPRRVLLCGVDCHPGDANCNNYCNRAPQKGPMAAYPPPGPDAQVRAGEVEMGDDLFFLDSKKEAEHWKRCAAWLADCHAATTQTLAEIKGTSKYELRRHQAIVQKAAALLRGIELPGTLGTDAARVAARCDDAAERCERRLSPER